MVFLNTSKPQGLSQLHRTKHFEVGFGSDQFHPDQLLSIYGNYSTLHQVHGKEVVRAQKEIIKADGHWTSRANHPLVIKTADCMPVFLGNSQVVLALHIGWRGLAQRILSHAFSLMKPTEDFSMIVGPHISSKSFELDFKSVQQILQPHGMTMNEAFATNVVTESQLQNDHYFVDLQQIVLREANTLGITDVTTTHCNTYTSPQHYSHRRNRWRRGLNHSYIVKTNDKL